MHMSIVNLLTDLLAALFSAVAAGWNGLIWIISVGVSFLIWPLATWFDTWLGFLGIVVGLALAAFYGWKPLRSAVAGYACGVLLVVIVNGLGAEAAPCLEKSRGLDILRAYSYDCASPPAIARPAAPSK
jgi:hypothetical protein